MKDFKDDAKRPKIWLEPTAVANPAAVRAILRADLVVVALLKVLRKLIKWS